jgi:predicted nucleic acid-binding protein
MSIGCAGSGTIATFIDTNILIDVLGNGRERDWSVGALKAAFEAGELVINALIWSELASPALPEDELADLLDWLKLKREPVPFAAAYRAGLAHRRYREAGGQRERTLPDFVIGAHADLRGHTLLTRDASRCRSYFPSLSMIAPDTHP